MDIEELSYEQTELFGEFPVIPQWEAITDEVIADTTETSNVYPKSDFEEEFELGFI